MTNEEAQIVIGNIPLKPEVLDDCYSITEYQEAKAMAIEALEQQPCEDCISRQAVLYGLASIAKAKAKSDAQKALMGRVMFFTEQLPSATPQPKIGRWIEDVDRWGDIVTTVNGYMCSECNAFNTDKDNFCPNCGAKMQEVKE